MAVAVAGALAWLVRCGGSGGGGRHGGRLGGGLLDVILVDEVGEHGRDRLLPVVQVHEAADVALHVRLVARVLELAAKLHHLVPEIGASK
jgi:hypothetical protein